MLRLKKVSKPIHTQSYPRKYCLLLSLTFENILGIKQKFTKYLKESSFLISNQHFSYNFFPKESFYYEIISKNIRPEFEWVNPFTLTAAKTGLTILIILL